MGFDSDFLNHTLNHLREKSGIHKRVYERIVMHDVERWPGTPYTRNPLRRPQLGRVQTVFIDGTSLLFQCAQRTQFVDEVAGNINALAMFFKEQLDRFILARPSLCVIVIAFDRSEFVTPKKQVEWDQREMAAYLAGNPPLSEKNAIDYCGHPRIMQVLRSHPHRDQLIEHLCEALMELIVEETAEEFYIIDGWAKRPPHILDPRDTDPAFKPWTRFHREVPIEVRADCDKALLAIAKQLNANAAMREHMIVSEWYVNDGDFMALTALQMLDPTSFGSDIDTFMGINRSVLVHLNNRRAPPSPLIDVGLWAYYLIQSKYALSLEHMMVVAFAAGSDYVKFRPPYVGYITLWKAAQTFTDLSEWPDAHSVDGMLELYRRANTMHTVSRRAPRSQGMIERPDASASENDWIDYRTAMTRATWHSEDEEALEDKLRITIGQVLWQLWYFKTTEKDNGAFDYAWNKYMRGRHPISYKEALAYPEKTYKRATPRMPSATFKRNFKHVYHMFRIFSIKNREKPEFLNLDRLEMELYPYLEPYCIPETGEWVARWTKAYYPAIEGGSGAFQLAYRFAAHKMTEYGYRAFDWRKSNKPYVWIEIPDMRKLNAQQAWYFAWNDSIYWQRHYNRINKILLPRPLAESLHNFYFLRNGNLWPMVLGRSREIWQPATPHIFVREYPPDPMNVPVVFGVSYILDQTGGPRSEPLAVVFSEDAPEWARSAAGRFIETFLMSRDPMWTWGTRAALEDICFLQEIDPNQEMLGEWAGAKLMLGFYAGGLPIDAVTDRCKEIADASKKHAQTSAEAQKEYIDELKAREQAFKAAVNPKRFGNQLEGVGERALALIGEQNIRQLELVPLTGRDETTTSSALTAFGRAADRIAAYISDMTYAEAGRARPQDLGDLNQFDPELNPRGTYISMESINDEINETYTTGGARKYNNDRDRRARRYVETEITSVSERRERRKKGVEGEGEEEEGEPILEEIAEGEEAAAPTKDKQKKKKKTKTKRKSHKVSKDQEDQPSQSVTIRTESDDEEDEEEVDRGSDEDVTASASEEESGEEEEYEEEEAEDYAEEIAESGAGDVELRERIAEKIAEGRPPEEALVEGDRNIYAAIDASFQGIEEHESDEDEGEDADEIILTEDEEEDEEEFRARLDSEGFIHRGPIESTQPKRKEVIKYTRITLPDEEEDEEETTGAQPSEVPIPQVLLKPVPATTRHSSRLQEKEDEVLSEKRDRRRRYPAVVVGALGQIRRKKQGTTIEKEMTGALGLQKESNVFSPEKEAQAKILIETEKSENNRATAAAIKEITIRHRVTVSRDHVALNEQAAYKDLRSGAIPQIMTSNVRALGI
jgi:hypothetical protein